MKNKKKITEKDVMRKCKICNKPLKEYQLLCCSRKCYTKLLKKAPQFKYQISKQQLIDLYVNKKYGTVEIGQLLGVKTEVIQDRLTYYNIPRRSIKEACEVRGLTRPEITYTNKNKSKGCYVCENKIGRMHLHHKDGDDTNHQKNNFIILCQGCHQRLHRDAIRNKLEYKKNSKKMQYLFRVLTNSKAFKNRVILDKLPAFTEFMKSGLLKGAEKYGTVGLVGDNQLEMALEEIRDLSNYMYLTYLKIQYLSENLLKAKDIKELTNKKSTNKADY